MTIGWGQRGPGNIADEQKFRIENVQKSNMMGVIGVIYIVKKYLL